MQTATCKRAACGLAVPPYQRAKPINLPSNATDASRGRPPAFFETLARPSTRDIAVFINITDVNYYALRPIFHCLLSTYKWGLRNMDHPGLLQMKSGAALVRCLI